MRVQQAMLGKVLDEVDLLQQVISSQDQDIKNISKALTDMVGRIYGLEKYTKKGKLRKGYTIKDDIKKAVRKLVKAKLEAKSLSDIDMVDLTPAQQELVKSFSGAKSVRQIKNAILQYTNAVGTVARNQKFSKLKPIAPKEEILKTQRLYQEQGALADEMNELDRTNEEYTAETININGKERPVYNSEGNRIAKSEKALRAFYEWFGDSKVVDDQGRPLVVYHGTNAEFDTFENQKVGDYGKGFYFVDSKLKANEYAIKRGGNITMPMYLSIKNPFKARSSSESQLRRDIGERFTNKGLPIKKEKIQEILSKNGYDGVVIPIGEKPFGFDYYLSFEPNQIKSVDNRGTFDINNPNIYYQMVGEKSLTADLNKLSEAKRLHEQGASNEEIRQKTGWFLAKDEKWRYEISDKDSKINDAGLKELEAEGIVKLKDLLIDDNLFNAYPNLKNMSVTKRFIGQALALFNGNGIVLSEYLHDKKTIRSVLKHELQHAIQQIEGFAKGGSPEMFSSIEDLRKDFDFYNRMLQKNNKYLEQAEDLGWGDNTIIPELSVDDIHYTVKDAKKWKKEAEEKLGELQKEIDNYETPFEKYKKLLGEAEANEVQERLDMTDRQRKNWKNKPKISNLLVNNYIAIMQDGSVFYHVDDADNLALRTDKSKYLTDNEVKQVNEDNEKFIKKIELLENGKLPKREQIVVLTKLPSAFNNIKELNGRRLFISQDVYKKIVNLPNKFKKNHNVARERALKLPTLIADPNYILQSTSKGHEDRFVVVTKSRGNKPGLRLSVIIQPNTRDVVVSAYDENINISIEKKEGRVLFDKKKELESEVFALNAKGLSNPNSSTISQSYENVNSDGKLYQKAYVSMKGELVGDYLDADEFEGTGEGAMVHGWGNYLRNKREKMVFFIII